MCSDAVRQQRRKQCFPVSRPSCRPLPSVSLASWPWVESATRRVSLEPSALPRLPLGWSLGGLPDAQDPFKSVTPFLALQHLPMVGGGFTGSNMTAMIQRAL